MADSIHHWIAPYLVDIAEQYGANIPFVPKDPKRKKVQLTEWLTFGNEDKDSLLWARISDKQHTVPIRFSSQAVAEYNRLNSHRRITQQKTAVVFIKDFKPFFTRVPRGGNMKLSDQCVLAMDCDSVSLFGSFDEARFGSPREIEANGDLHLWSEGLRRDGGGGNVLKQRKDAKQNTAILDVVPNAVAVPPPKSITPPAPKTRNPPSNATVLVSISNGKHKYNRPGDSLRKREQSFPRFKSKPAWRSDTQDAATIDAMPVDGDDLDEEQQKRQNTDKSRTTGRDYYVPQQEEANHPESCKKRTPPPQHALELDSPLPSKKAQSRESSPGVPITNWSPSPPPVCRSAPSPRPAPRWAASPTQTPSIPSSHPTAPTPAQRQRDKMETPPPSSPPPENEVVAQETMLLPPPSRPLPSHDKYPVIRKVPRPPQPLPPNQFDSGPTQILVPNSDTSLSYSQSQPQSQSQSQSRSLEEVPESSQPVVLSQLSALSKPRKNVDPDDPFADNAKHGRNVAAEKDGDRALFSASFNEDAPYEGDRSSPDHANEDLARITKRTRLNGHVQDSPLHSTYSHQGNEVLTDASMIAQPAVTQRDDGDNMDEDDNAPNVAVQGLIESQSDAGLLSANHLHRDNIITEVTQELDEDDAQIHRELFGSSYVSQLQETLQRHSPPGEYVRDPVGSIEPHADTDHSQFALKLATAAITSSTQTITEGENSRDEMLGTSVGVVQHDANAWSAPSFLRPSSNANAVVHSESGRSTSSFIDPPLGKSKVANVNSANRGLRASLSREASFPHSRPPHVDQNQDPAAPRIPQQPKKPAQAQTPGLASLELRSNKRRKDVTSDLDTNAELSRPQAKRRKVEQAPPVDDPRTVQKVVIATENANRGKLGGFSVNLDRIVLSEESAPLMNWLDLRLILQKTGRDRDKQY